MVVFRPVKSDTIPQVGTYLFLSNEDLMCTLGKYHLG